MNAKTLEVSADLLTDLSEQASIELSPEERPALIEQLNKTLEYLEKIRSADLDNVEPTVFGRALDTDLRADTREASLERERMLANAPSHLNGEVRLPKIVE